MRHGVILLPEQTWSDAQRQWRRAEEFGFDHAWVYDHLIWRWMRERTWFATLPTLTAAAAATSRLQLGTMVAAPGNRHPVSFAKEIMTLDALTEGRLICGIAAGAGGRDDVTGYPELSTEECADRFTEFVELTAHQLSGREDDYQGQHFSSVGGKRVSTRPDGQRVPLAIGAIGECGIARAALHADIWVTIGWPGNGEPRPYEEAVPVIRMQTEWLEMYCGKIGRDPSTVRRLVVTGAMIDGVLDSLESYRDACGQFGEIGVTDVVVHWPRPDFPYQGSVSVLEEIASVAMTH